MKKNEIKYLVDLVSLLAFVVLVVSGFVLWFALPRGGGRQSGSVYLGIVRNDWIAIHDWTGVLLIISIGIHLLLNLKWIVSMTKTIFLRAEAN